MKKQVAAIIVLVMVALLSVAGCTINNTSPSTTATPTVTTPSQTPTLMPPADYSSYYNKLWERSGFIVERPFTKSTNVRGNDVYMGVMRNTSLSQGSSVTTVTELTKSKTEAKQVYDKSIADKSNEGFTYRADWMAQMLADPTKAKLDGLWVGSLGTRQFHTHYWFNPEVNSWELTTETS